MRFTHQLAESVQIAGVQATGCIAHPLIFLDHVLAALVDNWGNILRVLHQLSNRKIAKSTNLRVPLGKDPYAFLALLAPPVVLPACVLMLDHGIADHQLYGAGNRDELEIKRTAIEKKYVAGFSQAGDKLVHDADPSSNKSVLSALAEFGHVLQWEGFAVETKECKRAGHFNSRRRTEARADGYFALHEYVCGPRSLAALL